MAAMVGVAQTGAVALAAATAKTVVQILTVANHRAKILGWGVFFDGVSPTAVPVLVELVRQTDAGTMTSLTPIKVGSYAETLLTTAQHTATAEPTTTDLVDEALVPPTTGFEKTYAMGQEPIVGTAGRIALRVTAPAIVNVRAKITFEE